MTEKNFAEVDITPKGVDGGRGQRGRNTTVFQESEIRQIHDNPGRLTREGCEKKLELWKKSTNAHNMIKYNTMLARCKNFEKSGKDEQGFTIYSYDAQGRPNWTSKGEESLKKQMVAPVPEKQKSEKGIIKGD